MSDSLTTDQEAEAKELEAKIRRAVDHEIVALARLLVSKSDRELFGHTEFQVRDLLLRVGAKAYQEHLREKKRLRRLGHRLPKLQAKSRVPGLPAAEPLEHSRSHRAAPRLLLLPSLWRRFSLGSTRWPDGQTPDACCGRTDHLGRDRQQ